MLAPHADDETIGCGGIIQKYIRNGSPVRVVIASFLKSATKRYRKISDSYVSYQGDARFKELEVCMRTLGVEEYRILFTDYSDETRYHSKLDAIPRFKLIEPLEDQIMDFKPTILFIPSVTKHQDHEALHHAAIAAARPYFWNGSIAVYETDGEKSFHPNLYVPLDDSEMSCKLSALEAYRTQIQNGPHPVSVQAVMDNARYRGSHVYETYAEAFELIRFRG